MELDFDRWWVVAIVLAGVAFGGWGMVLEHKRKLKALDIVREAMAQGREVPPSLLEGLTRDPNNEWLSGSATGTSGWGNVAFFVMMAAGFGFAAWFYGGRAEGAFWLVTAVMAGLAIMTAINQLTRGK